MFSGKNSRLFEGDEDVEMREQSSTREQTLEKSAKKSAKSSLLDQFHEPEMKKKPLNNFIDFSDSEQESPAFNAKKIPFGNRIFNQIEDNDAGTIIEVKKMKKKMKLGPPAMYTNRQFSFNDNFELPPTRLDEYEKNSVLDLNPNDKISCKKNLFGNMDENMNPNLDNYMFQSPEKSNNMPLDQFLEDEFNNLEMQDTRNLAPNLKQKWNKGDIIFKGKFSSGVTPKIDRPVIKGIKVKTKDNKRKHEEIEEEDEYGSKEGRRNPFLEITPQMKRKVRKWSFENNGDMVLDFSSPTRERKLVWETPMPVK